MAFESIRTRTVAGIGRIAGSMRALVARLIPEKLNLKRFSPDALRAMQSDILAAAPQFAQAGFTLVAIELELTLSPRILIHARPEMNFDREKAEAIQKTLQSQAARMALGTLIRTMNWGAQNMAGQTTASLSLISVDLSLAPGVRLLIRPKSQPDDDIPWPEKKRIADV